jgi:hypothetical protein
VLVALSVLWIRKPLISGVCLGLTMGSTELASFLVPAYLLVSLDTPGPVRPATGPGVGTLAGGRPLAGALPRCPSDGLGLPAGAYRPIGLWSGPAGGGALCGRGELCGISTYQASLRSDEPRAGIEPATSSLPNQLSKGERCTGDFPGGTAGCPLYAAAIDECGGGEDRRSAEMVASSG